MNTSPTMFERDERGLVKGIQYHYTTDGRVDYRRMVDPKFLYIAREYEDRVVKQQGKPLSEIDILQVKDEWLRIRIGGLNQLANLRGYRSIQYHSFVVTEGKASIICEIEFIGNFETDSLPVVCSSVASACRASMDKQFLPYLETFAENRAFGRTIKRALQINILSDIEVGGDGRGANDIVVSEEEKTVGETPATGFEPYHVLQELCKGLKDPITFDTLKAAAAAQYQGELKSPASEWTDWSSIQPIDAWLLLGKIKAKNEAVIVAKKAVKGVSKA